ncbi:dethiobiotin synthase [Spirulina subsalsa]|uniref:dethiobiotin synthase n=1 Tax=Spirulina subsalsa TaxID=54311 RepID=UPI0003195FF3|nr:dethiobiotin synthase [Spirulina subsalsa]
MNKQSLLITATDTDAGKTVLTSALVAYWYQYHNPTTLGLMKLMQTGVGDRELYQKLFQLPPEVTTPLVFDTPVAPPVAALQEGRTIDLSRVWQHLNRLQQEKELVLIEALGGLGSPVTAELTVADLGGEWRLEAVLVVPVKLGAIGQTVAHVALARQAKIPLRGIVFNCTSLVSDEQLSQWIPIDLIESLTHIPVLGIIPYLSDPKDRRKLAQVASNLDLERLWGSQILQNI